MDLCAICAAFEIAINGPQVAPSGLKKKILLIDIVYYAINAFALPMM